MLDIGTMMRRGIDNELILGDLFRYIRRYYADQYVWLSSGALFVVSIFIMDTTFGMVITYALWTALAFTYLAVGTKSAHTFAFVVSIVGLLMAALSVFGVIIALAVNNAVNQWSGESLATGELIFRLIFFAAMAAFFGHIAVGMYRVTQSKSLQYPVRQD